MLFRSVEAIRGVACGETIRSLMEKHLVRIDGRAEEPGRPILYGTTQEFLEHFGLKSIQELPPLSEYSLKDLDPSLLPPELKANGAENSNGNLRMADENNQNASPDE